MAQDQNKRGRTSGMSVLLVLLLILVGAAGAVGTLLILGDGSLFGSSKKGVQARERNEDHTGQVRVPLCAAAIEPYAVVSDEHLINPQLKDFAMRWVDADKAKAANFITDLSAIRGRVTARPKRANYAFTEADFMPRGTRPGPAGAVEAGMRGLWMDPEQVEGFEGLALGDRFDLVATMKVQAKASGSGDPRFVSPDVERAKAEEKAWDTSKRILVKNGKIILPLPGDAQQRKGKKVFIQVAESEADPLTDAIAVGAKLMVLFRSSQPGAGASDLPEPEHPPEMESIEVIQGGKSSSVPVPAGGGQEAPQDQPK